MRNRLLWISWHANPNRNVAKTVVFELQAASIKIGAAFFLKFRLKKWLPQTYEAAAVINVLR